MSERCEACGKLIRGDEAHPCEDCGKRRCLNCKPYSTTEFGYAAMRRRGYWICGTCADTACSWCGGTEIEHRQGCSPGFAAVADCEKSMPVGYNSGD